MIRKIQIGTASTMASLGLALACQNLSITEPVPLPPEPNNPGAQVSPFLPLKDDGSTVLAEKELISMPLGVATLALDPSETFAVSADADRGAIRIVNLEQESAERLDVSITDRLGATVAGSRFAFVLAPGSGSVHKVQISPAELVAEAAVCPVPEGLALSSDETELFVACRGGELVTLHSDTLEVKRSLTLASDLRDVAEFRGGLVVSRFRPSELLVLDGEGTLVDSVRPDVDDLGASTVAWRMRVEGDSIFLLHQVSAEFEVATSASGYGFGCGSSIVTPVLSQIAWTGDVQGELGGASSSSAFRTLGTIRLHGLAGAVDFAFETSSQIAVIAPGNGWAPMPRVPLVRFAAPLTPGLVDDFTGCSPEPMPSDDPSGGDGLDVVEIPEPGGSSIGDTRLEPPVAIASSKTGTAVLALRQSAAVGRSGEMIPTDPPGVERQGQRIFHMSTDTGIACVSCHPGGGDDSHTWKFSGLGLRRTQSLEGGISQRAPFHWDGEFPELNSLMSDVFVGRMGSTLMPSPEELAGFVAWLDGIGPSAASADLDTAKAARGAKLFASEEVGCATCHSGPALSDGKLHDVGTGRAFITPHLTGIGTRPPYMHDGCAADLKARFGTCGGGDTHGVTSNLSSDQIDDLVAFLNTL